MRKTNVSILEKIRVSRQLLHTINIQMLSYFGHITRQKRNNLEKIIMQGMIEGKGDLGLDGSTKLNQLQDSLSVIVTCLLKTVIYGNVFMRSQAVSHDRNEPTNHIGCQNVLLNPNLHDKKY